MNADSALYARLIVVDRRSLRKACLSELFGKGRNCRTATRGAFHDFVLCHLAMFLKPASLAFTCWVSFGGLWLKSMRQLG